MLKLLNKQGLPNVVSFELSEPQYNNMAMLNGFPVKNRDFQATSKILRNHRANKYLSKQFSRLEKAARNGDFEGFDSISKVLLRRSISYMIHSLNHVHPNWTSMDMSKVRKLLIRVQYLTDTLETDIYYKRLWIDKKPGDYGRPLGVPISEWRIYLNMITHIGEIFAKGRNLYSDNQHGGRPGKGVMSCLKDVAENLIIYPKVYEFDLKGFFDHISHISITHIFKGTFLEEFFDKLLKAKPKEYKLPAREEDQAWIKYKELQSRSEDKFISVLNLVPELENHINFYSNSLDSLKNEDYAGKEEGFSREEVLYWLNVEMRNHLEMFMNQVETLKAEQENVKYVDTGNGYEYYEDLQTNYKALMGNITAIRDGIFPYAQVALKDPDEWDRVIGRENWKNLNLPDQGVPQGTSFGPFLSSLAVAIYFEGIGLKDWKMYVDDGLIFCKTEEELKGKLALAKEALDLMSVEMEPTKSRLHTTETLMSNSMKFLGVRFQKRSFFTISSDTRKGVKRELPELTLENAMRILENMYQDGMITVSRYKYTKWAIAETKLRSIIGGDQLSLSIKYGYFGYLLSWLYNPEADMTELKRRISQGIKKAEGKIIKQPKSLGNLVLQANAWRYKDTTGMIAVCVPDLNNHSSLCVDLLLESIEHGYVSLRDYGLVSKSKKSKDVS